MDVDGLQRDGGEAGVELLIRKLERRDRSAIVSGPSATLNQIELEHNALRVTLALALQYRDTKNAVFNVLFADQSE